MTPGVPITLDRPRTLRYDVNTIAELESLSGDAPLLVILTQRLGVKAIRDMLWIGLRHEDRKLTPNRVGTLMQDALDRNDGTDFGTLTGSIIDAMRKAGIVPSEPKADEEAPAGNP